MIQPLAPLSVLLLHRPPTCNAHTPHLHPTCTRTAPYHIPVAPSTEVPCFPAIAPTPAPAPAPRTRPHIHAPGGHLLLHPDLHPIIAPKQLWTLLTHPLTSTPPVATHFSSGARSLVAWLTCMAPGAPVLSMRDAVLMVSPNRHCDTSGGTRGRHSCICAASQQLARSGGCTTSAHGKREESKPAVRNQYSWTSSRQPEYARQLMNQAMGL